MSSTVGKLPMRERLLIGHACQLAEILLLKASFGAVLGIASTPDAIRQVKENMEKRLEDFARTLPD